VPVSASGNFSPLAAQAPLPVELAFGSAEDDAKERP
jgi:hypothetical protein